MSWKLTFCSIILFTFFYSATADAGGLMYFNVKDYGAKGNGVEYDTEPIQAAINQAAENGGGTVYFPAGKYLIKPIELKGGIRLYLENGCVILGSTNPNDYSLDANVFIDTGSRKLGGALINATDAVNIAIEGNGTIDGQGFEKFFPLKENSIRPFLIRMEKCKNVKVKNISLINSAAWVQHYIKCEDLEIRNIYVRSYSNKNNDGLELQDCRRVIIEGCNIDSGDDSIVLKSHSLESCRDIVISNCIISGLKSAIKTGTESVGGFENITISNCVIYGTRGISLLCVDGGFINNVTVSNISMRGSYAVIVIRLGARMSKYSDSNSLLPKMPSEIKNIMVSNIQADGVTESNDFISGVPGQYVKNVSLNNIRIQYAGGGRKEDFERKIPELIDEYPKAKMFGMLPSYGFYVRHAKNISLKDIFLTYQNNEERPVIYCDDVENLTLTSVNAKSPSNDSPYLFFRNVSTVTISNCEPEGSLKIFTQFKGENTSKVKIYRNNIEKGTKIFTADDEIDKNKISVFK